MTIYCWSKRLHCSIVDVFHLSLGWRSQKWRSSLFQSRPSLGLELETILNLNPWSCFDTFYRSFLANWCLRKENSLSKQQTLIKLYRNNWRICIPHPKSMAYLFKRWLGKSLIKIVQKKLKEMYSYPKIASLFMEWRVTVYAMTWFHFIKVIIDTLFARLAGSQGGQEPITVPTSCWPRGA